MIGSRIRHIRLEKGISLADLSRKTGIVQTYLSIIEKNLQSNPTHEYTVKIANALEVDHEYLLKGLDSSYNEKGDIVEYLIYFRKCIVQMSDSQLEEMKDFLEFTIWKRNQLKRGL
ncbi:helix-turn-helix domain-containing protein [Lederbergia lenta]|uniref:Transcriptional regulator n=1 Tax=Lederbergia lenta TaxID=1467 RepID=A0A2X4ZKK7_LEDLE|nr:helix-turn-helix transcriptional regulator [Lederbergia lenta]MCM3110500.1 helix-turn-helix domain-containing protein [Lederbergia lenta]MEC2323934.1 helix-turn-helix transcriptional regulator [Lederbergia lenta]SQI60994.1 transcriptional regulator [Lederbergia lenta]